MTPISAYDERTRRSLEQSIPYARRQRRGRGFTRAIGWTLGTIGFAGAIAGVVMLAQSRAMREMARDMGRAWTEGRRAARRRGDVPDSARGKTPTRPGMQMLHDAILGNSKQAVAAVFGPPPTAVAPPDATGRTPSYWHADTWYYPLDPREKRAMAVRFDRGIAKDVEFIWA